MKNSCTPDAIDVSENFVVPVFLVEANDYVKGRKKVMYFLETTSLVKYDNIAFSPELSCSASDQKFWKMIDSGLEKNKQTIMTLIDELQKNGYKQLTEVVDMKQGYESKTLHVLVHFLDGFIGIDSSFYNTIEDSHQVSDSLRNKISQNPGNFWLLRGNAENPSAIPEASLIVA